MSSDASGFDVIVVGAGSVGCNAAWHLQRAGRRVAVLEATDRAASQSTNAAAGFVGNWTQMITAEWGQIEWDMQRYGMNFYSSLCRGYIDVTGFRQRGVAYLFTKDEARAGYEPRIQSAIACGTRLERLTAERAEQLLPSIRFDRLAAALYDPDAFQIRAGDTIRFLAEESTKIGVAFFYNTPVREFRWHGGTIAGVDTENRTFRAPIVIVAAGAWSKPLVEKAGVTCASVPIVETRYVTPTLEGLPEGLPLLIFPDSRNLYVREDDRRLLIGGSDPDPLPPDRYVDAQRPPRSHEIVPDQAFRVRQYIRELEHVMPVLARADIVEIASGLPTFTSDGRFIVDETTKGSGLFVMSGCIEAGVTHGPALGKQLAQMATGQTTDWPPERFAHARLSSP